MKPSKPEWMLALLLFVFLFASWNFGDTKVIIGHQIDFADAIMHGEFSNFYRRSYENAVYDQEHGVTARGISTYDLPMNLVFGIWGIPAVLLSGNAEGAGGIEYVSDFWKMLYGKSLFLFAFIICSLLVYKISRELGMNEHKAQWSSFIYFTSSMAVNSVCLVGNCDALGAALILAGVLSYVRKRDAECFFWFVIAFPFKQQALMIYLPLVLLRDKNLLKAALKFLCMIAFNTISDLPMRNTPEAFAMKNKFSMEMVYRLFFMRIPLMSESISVFILLYGLVLAYCYITPYPQGKKEQDSLSLFAMLASITTVLTCVKSHPQWFLQAAPYLAIAVMYYGKASKNIMFFETVGTLALMAYNFIYYSFIYSPVNAADMLLHILAGKPAIPEDSAVLASLRISAEALESQESILWKALHSFEAGAGAVWTACMIVIIFWLCRPQNADTEAGMNMRPYALGRMLINMGVCYLPLAFFLKTVL